MRNCRVPSLQGNRLRVVPACRTQWHRNQRNMCCRAAAGDILLEVRDLRAKVAGDGREILNGVSLIVREGETHAIMGTNGSGKSTLSKVLVCPPSFFWDSPQSLIPVCSAPALPSSARASCESKMRRPVPMLQPIMASAIVHDFFNASTGLLYMDVQVGHPDYEVTGGIATYKGMDLLDMEPEERARAGLFMSFQSPVEVPGVSNTDFLRAACNARRKALKQPELVSPYKALCSGIVAL